MKEYLIYLLLFYFMTFSSASLVNGILKMSWSPSEPVMVIDRFLTNNTQIQLKILCREPSFNASITREQIKKKLDKTIQDTNIQIRGRIGRIVGCLPLKSDVIINATPLIQEETNSQKNVLQVYYERLWKEMEQRTFTAHQSDCDDSGSHLLIDQYSPLKKAEISLEEAMKLTQTVNKQYTKTRRVAEEYSLPLANASRLKETGRLLTWNDGYYLIEIELSEITPAEKSSTVDVDIIVSMRNHHGGYISADERPTLIFYCVMCAIYAFFAVLWFVWGAFYWSELLKIQFWIGGVILIGLIEKSVFLAEYDTLNRNGYKVHHLIFEAEVFSCLKRTVSRMLSIIVALGYGIVPLRLRTLKKKILAMGILYFTLGTNEAIFRINTKDDETNNEVLIARLPLAAVDIIIYSWILTGLVTTTRTLRLRKDFVKLNVYRHFTNTIIFAIIASLLFMIWSLKSHFFTTCITNWRYFWVDEAFWHILSSIILLVIMFLFRPSNNNQRYTFVPLLDQWDNDDDEQKGDLENPVLDSVTMLKALSTENDELAKNNKQQQQGFLNRESNMSGNDKGSVEDS